MVGTREPERAAAWHARAGDDVLRALETSDGGLTSEEARARLERVGPNRLPTAGGPSPLALLARQVASPLMYALLVAAIGAIAIGEMEDGLVVLAVVVLNSLIGFAQEYKAGRAIAALAELVAEPARARRDGTWVEVGAEAVVPGDVLAVGPGERVAADLRVLEAAGLRTEEAALTGESVPVGKSAAAAPAEAPLGDRHSILHAGTLVAAGTGRGVVIATGSDTELGRISALLSSVETLQTPLSQQLDRVGRAITAAIAVIALVLGAVALIRGFPLADATLAGIGIAVAAVPEGLPAVVTIAFAIGVQRMARRHAIIRHLPAVETLGSTTVIASDKTGTLTQNRMTVQTAWTPATGQVPAHAITAELRPLFLAAVLCNDATVGEEGEGLGDPTETALLVAAPRAGIDVRRERAAHERLAAIPFDSQRQLMATLHRRTGGGATLYAKGAPEALLERCAGGDAAGVRRVVERLANEGQRVLLVAARAEPAPEEPIESALHDLRVLGLIAMVDPLRPEARQAVADCHRAGVRVLMVTGDHPATARAIGRALDLDQADVHARVAPEDKLRLVRSLQADGEVVAVTGDGVNDAPALRQADIGVAMGRGGTAAAKEAADMVLADDNFATLRAAIEEGRRVYDNLVKALAFVLPTSVGQALIIAVAVLAFPLEHGDPLMPIEPVQVLWINLIVAVALALPLAFEAREPHLMSRGPRARGASLLDRPLLVRTVLVGVTLTIVALTLFALEHRRQLAAGVPDDLALARSQTAAVTGAVLLQALYLLTCRSLVHSNRELGRWSNPTVQIGIALVLVLQALYVFAPFMHEIFGSARIDARALAAGAAGALIILPVTWLEERWRRRSLRTR